MQPYPDGGCFAKGVCFSFFRVHKQTGSVCRYAKLFCFLRVVRSLQMCSIVDSRSGSWICKLNVLEWCWNIPPSVFDCFGEILRRSRDGTFSSQSGPIDRVIGFVCV